MKILKINNFYSKNEIENYFATNFGPRIKGITLRKTKNGDPYIILFATSKGKELYGDRIDGDIFYYKGEGMSGDQKLTTANKALKNANVDGRLIYGFRQEETGGNYRYLGIIKVEDCNYINDNRRKVYEFKLKQEGISSPKEIKESLEELPPPKLTDESQRTTTNVSAVERDAAFRIKIKEIYGNRCAFCDKQRFTVVGYPEVQASHIYPKEKGGADDLRNGIALCRLHHWAFDSGLMALNDDLSIIIKEDVFGKRDYEEIYSLKDKKISLPEPTKYKPDIIFIKEHRKIHGFN